jgi:hypothetical protein
VVTFARQPKHAPAKMTRAYNETQAFMKIATAPLHALTSAMVESIARTHRVSVDQLKLRVDERRARELDHG